MEIKDLTISFIALQAWQYFAPESNRPYGGAELQIKLLAENFKKEFGCRVYIVTLAEEDGLKTFGGVDVKTISRSHSFMKKAKLINAALAELGTDIVVQRSWGYETFFAASYARKYKKKFIYMLAHLMDTDRFQFSDLLNPRKIAYKIGFRKADRITAQTKEQFDRLKPTNQKRTLVISNIYDAPETPNPDKKGVLWVGRAIEFKRPEVFIELARNLPDIPFTMIMNKSHLEDYTNELIQKAKELSNLKLIDFVPLEQIMEYFHQAKIFVSTSHQEGFPNTFLQAFRASTPVAVLSHDPDQIVSKHQLGVVAKHDFNFLQNEVECLYRDETRLKQYGENCRRYLEENHHPGVIMKKWKEMLTGLV